LKLYSDILNEIIGTREGSISINSTILDTNIN